LKITVLLRCVLIPVQKKVGCCNPRIFDLISSVGVKTIHILLLILKSFVKILLVGQILSFLFFELNLASYLVSNKLFLREINVVPVELAVEIRESQVEPLLLGWHHMGFVVRASDLRVLVRSH
jgi:hypothetical protein